LRSLRELGCAPWFDDWIDVVFYLWGCNVVAMRVRRGSYRAPLKMLDDVPLTERVRHSELGFELVPPGRLFHKLDGLVGYDVQVIATCAVTPATPSRDMVGRDLCPDVASTRVERSSVADDAVSFGFKESTRPTPTTSAPVPSRRAERVALAIEYGEHTGWSAKTAVQLFRDARQRALMNRNFSGSSPAGCQR